MSTDPKKQEAPDDRLTSEASAEFGNEPHAVSDDKVLSGGPNDNFPNSAASAAFQERMGAHHVVTFSPVQRTAHSIEGAARLIADLPDQDFYFAPGDVRGVPASTPKKDEMLGSRWAWADIDPPNECADVDAWRAETLARLRALDPPPTIINDSGRGYWAFYELDRVATPAEVEAINCGLMALVGNDGDDCYNVNRVARLPGTRNGKTGRIARVVEDDPSRVYRVEDMPRGEPRAKRTAAQMTIGDAVRVDDVNELGPLPDRAKIAIVHGRDENNLLSKDNTRSGWLFYVLCEMARSNVTPETALGVITDPGFGISAHVLDPKKNHGDPEGYARKQIENAYGEVMTKRAEQAAEQSPGEPPSVISIAPVDRDALPERPWLVEGLLLRGNVTIVAARGGAGKSLYSLQVAIMCATGGEWAYWKARYATKTLILNAEDDLHELQRRLLSATQVMGVDQSQLADNVFTLRGSSFTLFARNEEGKIAATPFYQQLIALCRERDIGLLVVDPLVETHAGLDENSNTDMKDVIVGLRSLSRHLQIPILVVHHSRKGQQAGDQDTARGGSAIVNAARIAATLDPMTEEEANLLPEDQRGERWRYVRFCGAKANYSGRAADRWLRLESIHLRNGGSDEGDSSPGMVRVDLAEAGALDRDQLIALLRAVNAAADAKEWWRHSASGPKVGRLDAEIAQRFGMSAPQAKKMAQQLLDDSSLRIAQEYSPAAKTHKAVVVVGKWPGDLLEDSPF